MRKIAYSGFGILLVCLGMLILTIPQAVLADGTVIYVDKNASGPAHDGSSWTTAYTTLQDALDYTNVYSTTPYEIWVAQGVYYPDEGATHVNDAVTETFRILGDNVELYGGFAATETLRTQRNWTANPTVLSGDIDEDDINGDGNFVAETWNDIQGSNASHVLYVGGTHNPTITAATIIDGFIITGGSATGAAPDNVGGGYYCANGVGASTCSPTLTNIIFSGNQAEQTGGGMFNSAGAGASSPTLTNVTFRGNRADFGGGMYNGGISAGQSNPTLSNVTFSDNWADYRGGGMSNGGSGSGASSKPVLLNVTFSGNDAGQYGGGMYNQGDDGGESSPTLTNVVFSDNQAPNGAGMFNYGFDGTSSPALTNVTFYGNQATTGGGMYSYVDGTGVSAPALLNCILWGNTATTGSQIYNFGGAIPDVSYSNVEWTSGTYTGTGNLNVDPQFVDSVTGNYRLQANSPMIDAGDPTPATCPAADLDGALRNDLRCDMGAFERVYSNGDTVIKTDFVGGEPYSFGPTWVRMTLAAADSGTVTVTKHLTYPGGSYDTGEIQATWWISSDLSSGLPVTLSLCYTDAEVAGLDEATLEMFRWSGSMWVGQNATPDPLNNCVTLTNVMAFSAWTLTDAGNAGTNEPTALTLTTLRAAWPFSLFGIVVAASLVGVVGYIRKRQR